VVVAAADRERAAIERFGALVADELNVKRVRFVSEAEELGRFVLKPNYRALGPRFGKRMPKVAAAVAALDAASAAEALRGGGAVGVNIEGREHSLTAEELQLVLEPLEGYQVERSGTHAVALNLELDDALRREGLAREVVHSVQAARKAAGLEVSDRISLTLAGDGELLNAARAHERYVAGETLATELSYDGAEAAMPHSAEIEGRELRIGVARASA
jgi:isoleucyl-tRNA synthetase